MASAVVVGALATVGCGSRPDTPDVIVLVSVDTLRADHLSSYGYPRETSPRLDALAASGVLFEDVSTPSPWTLPAHASLLTALYPSRHGVKSHEEYLPPGLPTLASLLQAAGYRTAAVVNSHNLSSRFGLDRGFVDFRYVDEFAARREPTREIVDQALAWLAATGDGKLFLFVHTYDVHSDYASLPAHEARFVAADYDGPVDGTTDQLVAHRRGEVAFGAADVEHLMALYDAGIRQADEELARLLDALDAPGVRDRTLVAVTSDHGEEFLEHGGVLHGRTQFQEVMRVPLILRGPGLPAGMRIAAPVSLLDVMPTLLAAVGAPAPAARDGVDLAPLWRGGGQGIGSRHLFGEADHNNEVHDVTRAVRHERFKLHFDRASGATQLYDLAADPGESDDVRDAEPAIAAALRERLDAFLTLEPLASPSSVELSEAEREKLRALGYVK